MTWFNCDDNFIIVSERFSNTNSIIDAFPDRKDQNNAVFELTLLSILSKSNESQKLMRAGNGQSSLRSSSTLSGCDSTTEEKIVT